MKFYILPFLQIFGIALLALCGFIIGHIVGAVAGYNHGYGEGYFKGQLKGAQNDELQKLQSGNSHG